MRFISKKLSVLSISKRIISNFSSLPPNFTLLSTTQSKDLKLNLHQYTHTKTNARIYHFENADPENAYASIIKTYVKNDTGCPHILQHLATCGSQKYPIRDPFFNMLKRSVNTYMNAWTGDDFTSYPFSSANPADWKNLYKVYLDMSLNALLNELDFRQQGWRYQIDEQGNRQLKGIVLNEMKGAYQDSDRQLMKQINMQLFKGTPYIYDSGGRPKDIVNLEYHQLKKMYQYYYHPSNMAFYFYGNNPIQESLQYLAEEYLDRYQNQSSLYTNINLNTEPTANKYKTITSYTSQTNNISINFNFGLNDTISPLQSMCLRVLSYILLQKSNAKIYKQFIETEIAQNIGFSGFNQSKIATFTVTLKGIFPNYQCQTFHKQFNAMLQEIAQKGIQQERIQQFVHQFQVNLLTPRENNGIRVLEECMNLMNHRLSFQNYLNPRPYLEEAAKRLSQPQFLQGFFNKFFIANNKMVVVRQLLAQTEHNQEKIQSKIVIDDKIIKQQQQQLLSRQNEPQDKNILPILKISELTKPKRGEPVLVNVKNHLGKLYQQYHIKIQQDINFYRLIFNFQFVDAKFLQGITLWMYNLNRVISTSTYSYNELTSQLANHTAGFNVFHTVGGKDDFNVIFQFSCLKKNVQKAFFLIEEMVFTPKFQKQNTKNAFKAFHNEVVQGLIENPMNQCLNQAAGQLTKTSSFLNTYQRTKQSLKIIKSQNRQIFYQISRWLNNCAHVKLIEHSNQKSIKIPSVVEFLLKYRGQKMNEQVFKQQVNEKGVVYNYMVNFCAQTFISPKYLSKQHAYVNLLLQLLQQDYLHPLIREKGGAYGTGAKVRNNGTISLSSYLDPNTITTFSVFDSSIKDLLSKDKMQDQTLLQAKIKQFGEVDRIKIPQNQGVTQILKGYTQQQFDQFRQALKDAKFSDLVQTGRSYLINTAKGRCVFGKTCPQGFKQQKLKSFLF